MERSKYLGDLVNTLSKDCFGMSLDEAHEKKVCIQCKKKVEEIQDEKSKMEYELSGLGLCCQDQYFEED